MAAKTDEVSVALSNIESVPKDVYTAEGIVFKEEAVEHEGKPDESGKNLTFCLQVLAIKAARKMKKMP